MVETCPTCGLAKDLCVCEVMAKDAQKIEITDIRTKFNKMAVVISGLDSKDIDLKELNRKLKEKFACGGTIKNGNIELQAGKNNVMSKYKQRVKELLINFGYPTESIIIK